MKECTLIHYSIIDNTGFTDRIIEDVIEIDADQLIPEKPLPLWKFTTEVPIVKYYDGESLDLEYDGQCISVISGGQTEILSSRCPENNDGSAGMEVDIRIEKPVALHEHPAWREMSMHCSFNSLIMSALPIAENDPEAARHFLRIFTRRDNLFLFNDETVNLLEEYAHNGNKYALYGLGRYHQVTQCENDSNHKSIEFTISSYNLGLQDAAVTLSLLHNNGDFGIVDKAKARQLLTEALENECDFAAEIHLSDMISGYDNVEKNPRKALDIIDKLIDKDIVRYGKGEENPMWYYLKGCAEFELYGAERSKDAYLKAAESGVIHAWADIAAAYISDTGEIADYDAYADAVEYGASQRCATCYFFQVIDQMDDYDALPDWAKEIESELLIVNLEQAVSLGSAEAAEKLGDIYRHGDFDVEADEELAFQWYSQGAVLRNAACYEKLFDMLRKQSCEKDEELKDMIALQGARSGSDILLKETVHAYESGRLTGFASEIEQYYLPLSPTDSKVFC